MSEETKEFFEGTEVAIEGAKNELIVSSLGTMEYLTELENTYKDVTVKGIKDLAGYNFISDGYKEVKKIRTQVEKRRKEITKPALDFQREVKKVADEISGRVLVIENHLSEQKTAYEDAKRAEEKKKFQNRCNRLVKNGWELVAGNYVCGAVHLSPEQIMDMDKEAILFNIEIGKKEVARKEAEKKRIKEEQEAIEKEREAIRLEREQMRLEREERNKQIEAEREENERVRLELEAQKKALDEQYGKVDDQKNEVEETKETETKETTKTDTESKGVDIESKGADSTDSVDTVPVKTDTVHDANDTVGNLPSELTVEGFERFRSDLLKLLNDRASVMTRKSLIKWAENNQL